MDNKRKQEILARHKKLSSKEIALALYIRLQNLKKEAK